MKVVLDTNVLVSALIKAGKPRELLFKIVETRVQLILSKNILEEFLEVVDDPKIRKYVGEYEVIDFLKVVGGIAKIVTVRSMFKVSKEDPGDDIIFRTAKDGGADYIVSGDNHLLSRGEFKGIEIVTVDKMLKLLKSKANTFF